MATERVCSIDGCGKPAWARGWCSAHLYRWRRHGNPLGGGPSPAASGEPLAWMQRHLDHLGDDCLSWPFGRTPYGYGMLTDEGRQQGAHRWACEKVHGAPPTPDHHAAHTCGNGHEGCVNPRHLYWASPVENAEDRQCGPRAQRGETATKVKLTEAEVVEIYALRGGSDRAVARDYGVSRGAISHIWRGRSWSWLTGAVPDDRYRSRRRAYRVGGGGGGATAS